MREAKCHLILIGILAAAHTPVDAGLISPAVGWQAELATLAHHVSGTVTIVDDDTELCGLLKEYFESEALKLNPDIPYTDVMQGDDALLPFPLIFTIVVTFSCLAFMWRVRHPKPG